MSNDLSEKTLDMYRKFARIFPEVYCMQKEYIFNLDTGHYEYRYHSPVLTVDFICWAMKCRQDEVFQGNKG